MRIHLCFFSIQNSNYYNTSMSACIFRLCFPLTSTRNFVVALFYVGHWFTLVYIPETYLPFNMSIVLTLSNHNVIFRESLYYLHIFKWCYCFCSHFNLCFLVFNLVATSNYYPNFTLSFSQFLYLCVFLSGCWAHLIGVFMLLLLLAHGNSILVLKF